MKSDTRPRPHDAPPALRLLPGQTIDSRELLGDSQEVVIFHQGAEYRLRRTRLDKLILTK